MLSSDADEGQANSAPYQGGPKRGVSILERWKTPRIFFKKSVRPVVKFGIKGKDRDGN
mgnify:CR=1 FL=1